MTGIIKFWNKDKGFGFITEDVTGKDYFVHISGILADEDKIVANAMVRFDLKEGRKGIQAAEVELISFEK